MLVVEHVTACQFDREKKEWEDEIGDVTEDDIKPRESEKSSTYTPPAQKLKLRSCSMIFYLVWFLYLMAYQPL